MTSKPSAVRPSRRRASLLERLEGRTLFTVTVGTPISNTFGLPNGTATVVDLGGTFDQTEVTGTVVRLTTSLGNIDLELYDKAAPKTSQNFVNYVANGLYDNTVIHRSAPGVLQGGGYTANGAHIVRGPAVKNEFSADRLNLRGTISMTKLPAADADGNPIPGGGPDSATSEWVINVADNPSLDTATGGFAVFGRVINNSLVNTVDPISALPVYDATLVTPVFSQLPVRQAVADGTFPTVDDFVFITAGRVVPETRLMNITAVSDNPASVSPVVNADGTLSLNYGATTGSARITVTATDDTGASASQSFIAGNGELSVQIGSGGVGSAVNFVESDGGRGSVALSKGGAAIVRFTGEGLAIAPGKKAGIAGTVSGIAGIEAFDTGTGTSLTVKTKGGDGLVDLAGLSTSTPLKSLSLKQTRATGTITIGGTVKTLAFGYLANATVTVGGSPSDGVQAALSLGSATDATFTSGVPIKSVKATEFLSTGFTPAVITAPAVSSVSTRGAFQESIATTGAIKSIKVGGAQKGNITGTALGSLSAASLDGGVFNLTGGGNSVGKVAVKGTITGTTIRAGGNIASVTATEVKGGRFYAGVDVPDEEFPPFLPTTTAQFTAQARIGQVKVTTGTEQLSVAAASIGKLLLGQIGTDGSIPFGIAAFTVDQFSGSTADTDAGAAVPFTLKGLDAQASYDAQVAALNLPFGNLIVTLF